MVPVEGAISLHLTHREGWRDPLAGEDGWEKAFARRHPVETDVMVRFWRTLAGDPTIEVRDRVTTLEEADALLRDARATERGVGS